MRITFYLLLLFSALTSFAEDSFERQQMNARTQPVGQVNLEDQTQVTISPKKEERSRSFARKCEHMQTSGWG